MGANSFLLEWIPFQMGFCVQESKQEVTKVVIFVKNGIYEHIKYIYFV